MAIRTSLAAKAWGEPWKLAHNHIFQSQESLYAYSADRYLLTSTPEPEPLGCSDGEGTDVESLLGQRSSGTATPQWSSQIKKLAGSSPQKSLGGFRFGHAAQAFDADTLAALLSQWHFPQAEGGGGDDLQPRCAQPRPVNDPDWVEPRVSRPVAQGTYGSLEAPSHEVPPPPPQATAASACFGSAGHPYACASPCRYVRRKGGCRHGDQCPNCHHSLWQRKAPDVKLSSAGRCFGQLPMGQLCSSFGHPLGEASPVFRAAEPRASMRIEACREPLYVKASPVAFHSVRHLGDDIAMAMAGPLRERTALVSGDGTLVEAAPALDSWSVGSVNHPHSCNKACKYFRKARGCKDGAGCQRCHMCVWSRNVEEKYNST